ncbi:MAG: nucleotidyltransferase family protein [Devosia sp.]
MTAPRRVVAIVLAAGRAERFGSDKLLYPLDGKPLAEHIAITLADLPLAARIAICPSGNSARCNLFQRHGFDIVDNPHPEHGMGTSIALGAQRAIELSADTLLVCLADMPFVTRGHLQALLSLDASAVATESGGTRSPPAAFARAVLPELLTLTGDKGARDLLRTAATVPADPAFVRDFDTPADFA